MTLRGFPVTSHLLRPPCKLSGCPPPVSLLFRNSRGSEDTARAELGAVGSGVQQLPPSGRPGSRPVCTCFRSEAPCPSGPVARATLPLRLCPWPMMVHPSGLISDFLSSRKPPDLPELGMCCPLRDSQSPTLRPSGQDSQPPIETACFHVCGCITPCAAYPPAPSTVLGTQEVFSKCFWNE